jgi:hypothetical protein
MLILTKKYGLTFKFSFRGTDRNKIIGDKYFYMSLQLQAHLQNVDWLLGGGRTNYLISKQKLPWICRMDCYVSSISC